MSHDLGSVDPEDYPVARSQPPQSRLIILALVVGVMAVLAGGMWGVYRMVAVATPGADVPMIRSEDQPTRKKPDHPGGMSIPNQDSLVFDSGHDESHVEHLLPPPDTPLPRPAPAAPDVWPTNPPAAIPATPAPPQTAAAEPPPTAKPPRPITPLATPATAPAPPVSALGKGYRLQLGAVRTPEGAKSEWERLHRLHGDILGTLNFTAVRADLGDRGIFYRIQAGPIRDAAKAEQDCSALKRRGVGCILVKP